MGKSWEVIPPAPAAKEGVKGMQRAPDRSFGEGFSFGWGAGRTPGALHHREHKDQVPPQMAVVCWLPASGKGIQSISQRCSSLFV